MKKSLLLLLASLFLISGSPLTKVTFTVPSGWRILNQRNSDSLSVRLYLVKKVEINSQTLPSNAVIQCYFLPRSITIEDADHIVAAHSSGAKYLLSAKDGDHWKTYLLVSDENGEQFVMLYRIGIYKGTSFEFVLSFPNDRSSKDAHMKLITLPADLAVDQNLTGIYCSPDYVSPFIEEFNSVCASMKIQGESEFQAKAILIDPPSDTKYYRDTTLTR